MTPDERKNDIAARLESAFSINGFTQPNVASLKEQTGTTLKTLYKYFPSKEDMIIGALDHRHQRYLSFLATDCPDDLHGAVKHVFDRLALWLAQYAPNGCMSLQALSSYPNYVQVTTAVNTHKADVRQWLFDLTGNDSLSNSLFILHEGMSAAWPTMGEETLDTTQVMLNQILKEHGLT
ncbi:TetR/AcrR family transcriptional regulator [Alteromonas sp. 1_MG-2023]|uniref:TetR/AcrR family transcriptional regulator n=1 Tax=Alteromonas sp. 1_MG-2023 TaxID=3062669 RepID=UPI0026E2EB7B|nr:TetR/AcrR family transcriptional regulator [Alteromonas sp. 1_MG-2023]MDO6566106.1 TetR/AcrR family transcriptional regulator [Alteromonas sp. 1_MG-2023]